MTVEIHRGKIEEALALIGQEYDEAFANIIACRDCHLNNIESIQTIKAGLIPDCVERDLNMAVEAYVELAEEDHFALRLAWTKGGVWTTAEYNAMKTCPRWSAAKRNFNGLEPLDEVPF